MQDREGCLVHTLYRILILRGIAWAAKQDDIERLTELCTLGARVAS